MVVTAKGAGSRPAGFDPYTLRQPISSILLHEITFNSFKIEIRTPPNSVDYLLIYLDLLALGSASTRSRLVDDIEAHKAAYPTKYGILFVSS